MIYSETLPDPIFTNHIESYWLIESLTPCPEGQELLVPTCTFNIVFTDQPYFIKTKTSKDWKLLKPGTTFLGQTNHSIEIKSDQPFQLYGIRFKPFAFSNIMNTAAYLLNDNFIPLEKLFNLSAKAHSLIKKIAKTGQTEEAFQRTNEFMYDFFKDKLTVDEKLRAQLNFIMYRKGALKISELFTEFAVSKVTLRKHFINKVGLTPKKVSQIWRMNYLLQMRSENPQMNLTSLCLKVGFYDQAHFIKDFKQLFSASPRKFFTKNTEVLKLSHHNISKRFGHQYDPK